MMPIICTILRRPETAYLDRLIAAFNEGSWRLSRVKRVWREGDEMKAEFWG